MNIEQTKCDHCGKIHDTPNHHLHPERLVRVYLKVNNEGIGFDFCDENCLREFLIKRAPDSLRKA